ncbi:hypothetical protein [Myroides profundi]|uniref:Uncharacterized protein n=1 Tax=Myroides profundi TaxID=480520 RepID=A0AAJ4W4G0_MYRPR|nr:hypothetical protein [Myroides profundi]AJH14537.1 hypothetical protein MPR_1355 [Myroides profundi]SEQ93371.1 hypothetical protein SAMN04488089_107153 [Myroides profundi]
MKDQNNQFDPQTIVNILSKAAKILDSSKGGPISIGSGLGLLAYGVLKMLSDNK